MLLPLPYPFSCAVHGNQAKRPILSVLLLLLLWQAGVPFLLGDRVHVLVSQVWEVVEVVAVVEA
jgi:hypothetical protein